LGIWSIIAGIKRGRNKGSQLPTINLRYKWECPNIEVEKERRREDMVCVVSL